MRIYCGERQIAMGFSAKPKKKYLVKHGLRMNLQGAELGKHSTADQRRILQVPGLFRVPD